MYHYVLPSNGNAWIYARRGRLKLLCSMYHYVLPSNGNAWIYARRERLKLYVLCITMYCQAMEMLRYMPGGRGSNSMFYVLRCTAKQWKCLDICQEREAQTLMFYVPLCTAKQWKCLDICQEGEAQTLCSMYYDVLPSNGNAWIYARRGRLKLYVLCTTMYCQAMEMLGYMPGGRGSNSMFYVLRCTAKQWKCLDICQEGEAQTLCSTFS